jgi:hypothetical protein
MEFHDVFGNRSVLTEANRGLTSYSARLWPMNSTKNSKAPLYPSDQGRSGKPRRMRA